MVTIVLKSAYFTKFLYAYIIMSEADLSKKKLRLKEDHLMKKTVLDFVISKTQDLLAAPNACQEVKAAANAWLAAVGTDAEAAETAKYIAELAADIMPIDGLIAFGETELALNIFGADGVKALKAHAQELKTRGAKYCDCPACTACKAILDRKAEIL